MRDHEADAAAAARRDVLRPPDIGHGCAAAVRAPESRILSHADDEEPPDVADVVDEEVEDLLSSSTVYADDLRIDSSEVQMESVEAEVFFLL